MPIEKNHLIEVEGPGGRCVVPASEEAKYKDKKGFKVVGPYSQPKADLAKAEEPQDGEKETKGDAQEAAELVAAIRNNKALAEFLDTHPEIEVDLSEFDTLRDRKEAVVQALLKR